LSKTTNIKLFKRVPYKEINENLFGG